MKHVIAFVMSVMAFSATAFGSWDVIATHDNQPMMVQIHGSEGGILQVGCTDFRNPLFVKHITGQSLRQGQKRNFTEMFIVDIPNKMLGGEPYQAVYGLKTMTARQVRDHLKMIPDTGFEVAYFSPEAKVQFLNRTNDRSIPVPVPVGIEQFPGDVFAKETIVSIFDNCARNDAKIN